MKTKISMMIGGMIIIAFISACEFSFALPGRVDATPTIGRQVLPQSPPIVSPTSMVVPNVPSTTPIGNAGTAPTTTETPLSKIAFWVDNNNTNLDAGECTNVHWDTTNASAVFYQNQPVAGTGVQKECFGAARRYDLVLRVVYPNGNEQKQTIAINVTKSSNPDSGQPQSAAPPASSSSASSSQPPVSSSSSSSQAPPPGITFVPIPTIKPNPTHNPIIRERETPPSQGVAYSNR